LGEGFVADVQLDRDGTLWAATQGGLSRVKNGRVATLTSKNGLPCDTVHWAMEDDDHSLWLYMACGLVRISRPELEAWFADPKRTVRPTVFDSSDGVTSHSISAVYSPSVAKSTDGKLWFLPFDGVSVIDPRHLPFNKLPPPVHIEEVKVDGKDWDASRGWRLPALTRDLEIHYTALSFIAPEKNRFKYKLEGHDPDWKDAGNERKASYNDLPPRKYRFRVMASNNNGVWNEAGDSLDFSIAPAYYQTTWFRASCVAAFFVLLWALYRYRLYQIAREFNARLEERVGERTRIARDFHDTTLQNFLGVMMKFSAVKHLIPERPDVQETLEGVCEQARQAIAEGRDVVQGLRSSMVVANDLASAISTLGEGLVADHTGQNCPEFRVHVEGKSRDLPPLVRDEVYRIAVEAVRNAFRHAQAKRIEVRIRYDQRQFRLQVRDNGKGIDQAVLSAGGREGHHGLPGIHERAQLAGGKLSVRSQLDSGTEIELIIPAALAYAKTRVATQASSSGSG
jgi:signal transduction histidine kinase